MSENVLLEEVRLERATTEERARLERVTTEHKQPEVGLFAVWMKCWQTIGDAVRLNHDMALIEAKSIQANADAQDKLIDQESKLQLQNLTYNQLHSVMTFTYYLQHMACLPGISNFHFYPGPDKNNPYVGAYFTRDKQVPAQELDEIQMGNQRITSVRDILQGTMTVLRQGAQVTETNLNSSVDQVQQGQQQSSSLLQVLLLLLKLISGI